MKESLWGYWLILLGIGVSAVMILLSNMTTSNQQDYYLLKEIADASMIDALDWSYYREYGEVKMNTQVFVEVFIRRFAESVSKNNSYKVDFYSVYQNPPSASIRVTTKSGDFNVQGTAGNFDIINSYDVILEADPKMVCDYEFYSIPYSACSDNNEQADESGYCKIQNRVTFGPEGLPIAVRDCFAKKLHPGETLSDEELNNIRVLSSEYLKKIETNEELEAYQKQYSTDNETLISEVGTNTNAFYDLYHRERTVNDVPWGNSTLFNEDYLARELKDVTLTVTDTKDETNPYSDREYALAWSGRFKCGNKFGDGDVVKNYRLRPDYSTVKEYNEHNGDKFDAKYVSSGVYSDTNEAEGYEWTPYYLSCMVGIKYKIQFYYEEDSAKHFYER